MGRYIISIVKKFNIYYIIVYLKLKFKWNEIKGEKELKEVIFFKFVF